MADEQVNLNPGAIKAYNINRIIIINNDIHVNIESELKTPDAKIRVIVLDADNYDKLSKGISTYDSIYSMPVMRDSQIWHETINIPDGYWVVFKNDGSSEANVLIRITK